METKMEVESPLVWPQQKLRTRPDNYKNNGSAKKTWGQYLEVLDQELSRIAVTRFVVTWNDPRIVPNLARDPGVAVWFDRRGQTAFSWQDILGLTNPFCTVEEINAAYRKLVTPLHPDRHLDDPHFDKTPYIVLTSAREEAIKWVKGTTDLPKGFVMPSDLWKEPRQNLYAIIRTLKAMRDIERFGGSQLYEGALHGFAGALPEKASINVSA